MYTCHVLNYRNYEILTRKNVSISLPNLLLKLFELYKSSDFYHLIIAMNKLKPVEGLAIRCSQLVSWNNLEYKLFKYNLRNKGKTWLEYNLM